MQRRPNLQSRPPNLQLIVVIIIIIVVVMIGADDLLVRAELESAWAVNVLIIIVIIGVVDTTTRTAGRGYVIRAPYGRLDSYYSSVVGLDPLTDVDV
jgi:hypothetical protein